VALTLRNWAFFAFVGCAVVVVAYWPTAMAPGDFSRMSPDFYFRSAANIVQDNIRKTASALTVLERRDAVLASLNTERTKPSGPRIIFDIALTPAARDALKAAFDAATAGLRPFASDVRTTLVIATERSRIGRVESGWWYLMPDATDGRTCLILKLENDLNSTNSASGTNPDELRSRVSRVLGPCAFYTAFGKPGSGVESWLRENNYKYARSAGWQVRNVPMDDSEDLLDASVTDLLRYLPASVWGPIALPVRACAHGNLSQCRAVLTLSDWDSRPPLGTRYAVARGWWGGWGEVVRTVFMHTFLADLVQFAGRDRFERFWRSPLPRDRAFATEMGMSIEEYTQRWLRGKYPAIRFGPNVALGSILLGLVLVAAMVSVTGLYAGRRQVG
jgi:hypothetical protein